jgi:uncharacterized membrane protein
MLIKLNSISFICLVFDMSSHKILTELILRRLDLEKQRKVLEDSYASGEISQSIYNNIDKTLSQSLSELEEYSKILTDRLTRRIGELEEQSKYLEKVLASLEMRYAAGKVDEERYATQNRIITLGSDATKQEIHSLKMNLPENLRTEWKLPEVASLYPSLREEPIPSLHTTDQEREESRLGRIEGEPIEVSILDEASSPKGLSKLPLEKAFHFYNGIDQPTEITADNLNDFCEKIKTISIRSVEFHTRRGDFEHWISSLGDTELAEQIRQVEKSSLTGEDLRKRLYSILKAR